MSSLLSRQFSQMTSIVPAIPLIIFTQDLLIFITFHLVIFKQDFKCRSSFPPSDKNTLLPMSSFSFQWPLYSFGFLRINDLFLLNPKVGEDRFKGSSPAKIAFLEGHNSLNPTIKSLFLSIFSSEQFPCFKCICQSPLRQHLPAVIFKPGWTHGGSCLIAGVGVGLGKHFHHLLWSAFICLGITALKVQIWACWGWSPGESRVENNG